MKKLSDSEVYQALKELKGWILKGNTIEKTFQFNDFKESVSFVLKIQPIADSMDHHPDVCIYYNKVIVQLTTHDVGGLTDLDIELAKKIDEITL
ncbi:4a-hydroxytetrahydrobiopterin dehydratase [Sulfurisphaera javensis]|uniref:Putative pterin-4-alpha-carbinolamine dehydratase n=1 Tax=Sulfurisphaera javensis TaxID=2049879 RepID=A0AAT9GP10_9CREN